MRICDSGPACMLELERAGGANTTPCCSSNSNMQAKLMNAIVCDVTDRACMRLASNRSYEHECWVHARVENDVVWLPPVAASTACMQTPHQHIFGCLNRFQQLVWALMHIMQNNQGASEAKALIRLLVLTEVFSSQTRIAYTVLHQSRQAYKGCALHGCRAGYQHRIPDDGRVPDCPERGGPSVAFESQAAPQHSTESRTPSGPRAAGQVLLVQQSCTLGYASKRRPSTFCIHLRAHCNVCNICAGWITLVRQVERNESTNSYQTASDTLMQKKPASVPEYSEFRPMLTPVLSGKSLSQDLSEK